MAWCPKCKNEYREGIKVCTECGCELVEEKAVYNMKPLIFGEEQTMLTLKGFLEYNDIKYAEIRYDEADNVYELLVKDEDLQRSQRIARVFMEQQAIAKLQELQEQGMNVNDVAGGFSETDEEAEEHPAKQESVKPYVNSAEQAEESRSSAWMLLVVGTIGLIVMILGIVGVIPLRLANSYMFYGVMCAVFLLFIVMGAVSMKNAKIFAKRAESENTLRDSLLKWCEESLTADKVDEQIENKSELTEELLYFSRYEIIKKMMNHQFMNLDQGFLDELIDGEVYDLVFGKEK
ncbi:MAG: zinc ribbon domain-containing protein [Lachnospiraceae bacterium]|nr:zinc ribbon domain-containing protein [Lachnospiraceae bacterium]